MKLFFLMLNLFLYSSTPANDAAKAYREQDYKKATEIYERMLLEEPYNPYIHYNLANSYYKSGGIDKALYHYIWAFKLNPRDSKIKNNLFKITSETGNEVFPQDFPGFLVSIYYFLSDWEIMALFEVIFIIVFVFLVVNFWFRKIRFMVVGIMIFLMIVLLTWHHMRKDSLLSRPCVTVKDIEIYSGPGEKFTSLATVPKARILSVIDEKDDFVEVGIPKENIKGWVKRDDVLIVEMR